MERKLIAVLAAVFVTAFFGMTTMARAAEDYTSKEAPKAMKEAPKATMEKGRTVEGFIVDTKCVTGKEAQKYEAKGKLDEFVTSHSKECLLQCKMGGCEFYSDGRLWKLDKEASKMIESYLKQPDSTPHIKAELIPVKGDKVTLRNIEAVK